jgi:hypothetical protein
MGMAMADDLLKLLVITHSDGFCGNILGVARRTWKLPKIEAALFSLLNQ